MASPFSLTAASLERAVGQRLEKGKDRLGDREANEGASRVGYCARANVLDALKSTTVPLKTAGKFIVGRALENEVVQLVRIALDGRVRATGANQSELKHPTAPLICHPDGLLQGPMEHDGRVYEGDGGLEIKTSSAGAFKKYQEQGLPLWYVDQVTVQMGLLGVTWALVVVANAESLSELNWWVIEFDKARFDGLAERACWLQEQKKAAVVPAGETNRGWCAYCEHRRDCREYRGVKIQTIDGAPAELGASDKLELESLGEELGAIEKAMEPLEVRAKAIKEEARAILEATGLKKGELETVFFEFRGGGSGQELDKKALEKAEPELVAKFMKPKVQKSSFYFTPKS